jgi:hypothetical protein
LGAVTDGGSAEAEGALGGLESSGTGVVRHYTTDEAAESIASDGVIVPGQSNLTYLTPDEYPSGAAAQAGLSLDKTPTGCFEIPLCRVSNPSAVSEVDPAYGQPGGGLELTTPGSIDVSGLTFVRF